MSLSIKSCMWTGTYIQYRYLEMEFTAVKEGAGSYGSVPFKESFKRPLLPESFRLYSIKVNYSEILNTLFITWENQKRRLSYPGIEPGFAAVLNTISSTF